MKSSSQEIRIHKIFGSALTIFILGAAAFAGSIETASAETVPSPEHSCSAEMGFVRSTVEYSDCVASLQRTAAAVSRSRAVDQDRATCTARGLQTGTPGFANCVLDQQDRKDNATIASNGR